MADSSKYLQSGHHSAHSRDIIVAIRVGSSEEWNISCMMGKQTDETDSTDLKKF